MKRFLRFLPLLLICMTLCGCELKSGEDLLAAPKPTEEFIALQTELDKELAAGAVYAAPVGGSNRGYVQQIDLDGDGSEEAIAFFRTSPLSNELYAKIYAREEDGSYTTVGRVDGIGVAIAEVSYPMLFSDGSRALQIGWQVTGENSRSLTVAALRGTGIETLLSTGYSAYSNVDLNEDGMSDLLLLVIDPSGLEREAMYYTFKNGCDLMGNAPVSQSAVSVSRITASYSLGRTMLYVEEKDETGIGQRTDIFYYNGETLRNIAIESEEHSAFSTYRSVTVNSTDIDLDSELEIPRAVQMYGYPTDIGEIPYLYEWYAYRPDQNPAYKISTYRNASERWYLCLPESWRGEVYAVRSSENGAAVTRFYQAMSTGNDVELLSIYCLTGESRSYLAGQMGLHTLHEGSATLYAARIPEGALSSQIRLSIDAVEDNFHLIQD